MTHIALSGMIGAGKTTLATDLGKALSLPVYYEPVYEKSNLSNFYENMKDNAFSLQLYLLNQRFCQYQKLSWSSSGGIQDRTIYEDTIFAKMLTDEGFIRESDFLIYKDLFKSMSKFMPAPSVIIHLDVTPEESLRRIRERGRDFEKRITLEYLESLHDHYEESLRELSRSMKVIKIDWNTFSGTETIIERMRDEGVLV